MLEAARKAAQFASGRTRTDLDTDELLVHALVRLVTIVGEASLHVSEATCSLNSQIPWRQIAGTRNRIVHGYWDVDLDVLWQIVSADLPPLAAHLQALLDAQRD